MEPKNNITIRDISTLSTVSELWSSEMWRRVVWVFTIVLEEPAASTFRYWEDRVSKFLRNVSTLPIYEATFILVHYIRHKSHNESKFLRM
jgi:hypothetical protein